MFELECLPLTINSVPTDKRVHIHTHKHTVINTGGGKIDRRKFFKKIKI